MDKESKKFALIWIAVLLFIYYCKKTNEKIEEFTDEVPTPNTLNDTLASSGLRIMFDGTTPETTYANEIGRDRLNGVNVTTSAAEKLVPGDPTPSSDETNLNFLGRCKTSAPSGATHMLATIKIPDSLPEGGTLNSLGESLLETGLTTDEVDCKYYTFTSGDLSTATNVDDYPGYFERNVVVADALVPVLFEIVSPDPAAATGGDDAAGDDAGDDAAGGESVDCSTLEGESACETAGCRYTAADAASGTAESCEAVVTDTTTTAVVVDPSNPCAPADPTLENCISPDCNFTAAVEGVDATCTAPADSSLTCELTADACPEGCDSTMAVTAVAASCEPASVLNDLETSEDINTALQQLLTSILLSIEGQESVPETITDIQNKINTLTMQSNADTTALSSTLTQIIADTEQLKTELSSDGAINEELDNITTLIAALTLAVQNIDTIEIVPVKTCGNTSGIVGESTNFDCSVGDFNNDPSIRCGGDCSKDICCTLPKQLEPPPNASPSPTEEPSNWVTYLIIVIIIGIIIGLGYMLK
jgi:hypothetical protein